MPLKGGGTGGKQRIEMANTRATLNHNCAIGSRVKDSLPALQHIKRDHAGQYAALGQSR